MSSLNPRISEFSNSALSVNKYKHNSKETLATRCLAGSLVKTLLSQEIFVTSVVDLKLNSGCGHMYRKKVLMLASGISNAFPGKCFVQYKLMLNFTYRSLSGIRSALVAAAASEPEANERGSAEDFSY